MLLVAKQKKRLSGPSVKFTSASSINVPGCRVQLSLTRLIISQPGMGTSSHLYDWKVRICEMEPVDRVSTLKDSRRMFSSVQFCGLVKGDFGQWRGERNLRSRSFGSAEQGTWGLVSCYTAVDRSEASCYGISKAQRLSSLVPAFCPCTSELRDATQSVEQGLNVGSEIIWNPRHQDGKTNGNQLCRFDGSVSPDIYY
jgi:hypothetical protein